MLGEIACHRPMIVTDPGIRASGTLDTVLGILGGAGVRASAISGVQADPPEAVVSEAVARALAEGADGVVGIGGGSSLDTAKLVALFARSPQPFAQAYGVGRAQGPRLPLVLAPTTAGTGSEVTPIAVVTTPTLEKQGIVAAQLLPDVAILDPDLTLSLPPHVTAATGIDAMVHAIESYTSKLLKNPISDALAVQGLRLLHGNLLKAVSHGDDRQAREAMLLGSMMAGMAFANAPVAAVHALAYPLGTRFHLPHGLTNALVLAPVLEFNAEACAGLYAELAAAVVPGAAGLGRDQASRAFIADLQHLIGSAGLSLRLRDHGVPESILPVLASEAVKIERLMRNNPRPVSVEDALRLYRKAW